MAIRFFDMFAGIGGFRSGLEAVGGFQCVGYCEIDPYAKKAYDAIYDTKGELYFADARKIQPEDLPDIDLICGGFPCQSFSIAGKREGFDDARGTLFFEIARLAAAKRPSYLLLENVPGLLSHDKGRTFAATLTALDELGYDVTWQVFNSKDYGVPQSRKRVYIVGFLRERCAGEVLVFTQTNPSSPRILIPGREGKRVYADDGVGITLTGTAGGFGGRTGLFFIDLNADPEITEVARCITTRQDAGIGTHRRERSAVFVETDEDRPFLIAIYDNDGNLHIGYIRRLMPIECWRLQGFTDEQFNKAAGLGISDAQLYKMAGNAVTVPVISALGRMIKDVHERTLQEKGE